MLVHLPREEGYGTIPRTKNGPTLAGYGAISMKNALASSMSTLPAQLARSVTWDRGKEMSAHAQFKVETGIPVFFADPHSPWQRGMNENTNGLLRQYFPKGTDLSRWSAEDIEAVAHALNTRPRKTLGWKTPQKRSTSSYSCSKKPVLHPPIESAQYTALRYTERLAEVGAIASIGTVGDSYDNALADLLGVLLTLLALAAPVLVGHTQLMEPRALIIGADIGHLLAGSFWIGGVLGLLLFLSSARVTGNGTAPTVAVKVVQRFSGLAVWSVAILAVSGTIMGIMIVGSFDTLVMTSYGLTLMLKIGIVIPVIAIAAYNRLRLLPRISSRPTARMQWQTLNRTLAYEAALLVAVLLLTGFLTNLSPAHEHHDTTAESTANTAQTVTLDADAQGLSLRGELEPALTGENEITFTLEYDGESVTPDEVTIRTRLPEHDLGPFEATAELDPATGSYSAQLDMPVAGEWQVQVIARVSAFAEPIVSIPISVR